MSIRKFLSLLFVCICCYANAVGVSNESNSRNSIYLSRVYESGEPDPERLPDEAGHETLARRRMPVFAPELCVGGNTLYYDHSLYECVISFVQDGNVVYEGVLSSTGSFVIPMYLSGTFEIHVYINNYLYVGSIEL